MGKTPILFSLSFISDIIELVFLPNKMQLFIPVEEGERSWRPVETTYNDVYFYLHSSLKIQLNLLYTQIAATMSTLLQTRQKNKLFSLLFIVIEKQFECYFRIISQAFTSALEVKQNQFTF